jgi:hypothetical protein
MLVSKRPTKAPQKEKGLRCIVNFDALVIYLAPTTITSYFIAKIEKKWHNLPSTKFLKLYTKITSYSSLTLLSKRTT